ncbi:hypothetical protein BD311DRAFT_769862 [Dichomitus squalens]|uniref:Uncharacterized protein n=1 Tax=Dichomitus squalens TaxID=114155 RepID=A0A4Q9M8I9_9APHY|nr:hypothetical protein BD311DRAFT_769862 [Dichomitus squalens]
MGHHATTWIAVSKAERDERGEDGNVPVLLLPHPARGTSYLGKILLFKGDPHAHRSPGVTNRECAAFDCAMFTINVRAPSRSDKKETYGSPWRCRMRCTRPKWASVLHPQPAIVHPGGQLSAMSQRGRDPTCLQVYPTENSHRTLTKKGKGYRSCQYAARGRPRIAPL